MKYIFEACVSCSFYADSYSADLEMLSCAYAQDNKEETTEELLENLRKNERNILL